MDFTKILEVLDVPFKYLAALIGYGFIYFIVLRLFKVNHIKKSLVALITGAILTFVTALFIMNDKFHIIPGITTVTEGEDPFLNQPEFGFTKAFFTYYSFLFVSILMMIVIPLIYFCLGKSRHQQFRTYKIKIEKDKAKVAKPTIREKKEFVFACFKHNGNYLLKKAYNVNSGEYYSAIIKKIDNNTIFHDEMIESIINDFDEDGKVNFKKLNGEITVKKDKDFHYYCYSVEISEVSDKFKDYVEVDPYELVNYELDELNKQAIYHIILRDYFNIEL